MREEAFDNRINGRGDAIVENLQVSPAYYAQPSLQAELDQLNLTGKHAVQFCYSSGRELLPISSHYGAAGTGFDIVENSITQRQMYVEQLHVPCSFSAMNILDIGCEYHQKFDVTLSMIGTITWFQDVNALFQMVSDCLKPKGIILIYDFHPLMDMPPLPGENCYCDSVVRLLEYKYFTAKPWIENNGMGYISGDYASKTFTSSSYSISELVSSTIQSGTNVKLSNECGHSTGLSDVYDAMDLPLPTLLMTEKV